MKTIEDKGKQNCYSCGYKGNIAGSCHSSCTFDWVNSKLKPPKASLHGIKKGWYMFPFNYDPVWQEEPCKAYSKEADRSKISDIDPFKTLLNMLRN